MIVLVTGGRDYGGKMTPMACELPHIFAWSNKAEVALIRAAAAARDKVWAQLDAIHEGEKGPIEVLVLGDCRTGVDALARLWAERHPEVETRIHEALWMVEGLSAGPKRNQRMVDDARQASPTYRPATAIVFKGGNGTLDCLRRCRKAGFDMVLVAEEVSDGG